LLVLPVLTFLVYFFSMKITRKFTYQPTQNTDDRQQACSTKMMDYTMPLMSVWMTFIVPAAVGVYWLFTSILGTIKQIIMSKVMPLPVFTEEDYKAAEKEYAGKQPKKIQKSANAGKVRSLHHIDDDDYDEQGNYIGDQKAEEPEEETVAAPEKLADNKMTEGAALKDDSDKNTERRGLFGKKNKKD
jgi:YidC/Oxa1 family membrane protein insertase